MSSGPSDIVSETVVVVGAGLMGTGIAHAFAVSGFRTILVDLNRTALERARSSITSILEAGEKLGRISNEDAQAALRRLSLTGDLSDASRGASILVETATELLDLKLDIIRQAEPLLAPGALIGTNTSALSVTEIAAAALDPSRVVGMHFFNPVHKMKLLEIVAGLRTSTESMERALAYGKHLGKTSIVVNDSPGLTTSRMSAMMGNEAMYMLQEGTASAEDIDTAHRLGFNHRLGPLELGDLTGWDTRLKVLRHLHQTLGEKFRPCPLITKMVKAGRTGRKSGAGVYEYDENGKVPGSGLRGGKL